MTRFLLDTSICVDLLRAGSKVDLARLRRHRQNEIAISVVTLAELHYGASKSARSARHAEMIARFCAAIAILPFDAAAAEVYGAVRAHLERGGTPIGPLDTLIGAHALTLDLTLITSNTREFRRIPELRVEQWAVG